MNEASPFVLIVEDDRNSREAMSLLVKSEGFEVGTASSLVDARTSLEERRPDLMLVDLGLPDGTGMELIDSEARRDPDLSAIVITGESDVDVAVKAMKSGASDYLLKPLDARRLRRKLRDFRRVREYSASHDAHTESDAASRIVGDSEEIRGVVELIERVGGTDAPVLVVGESGTGKELVARAIHERSGRRERPFVAVNCGAIPPQLTESQLFGHKKGSFTGAVADHRGFFEQADGGTLFLDEIIEMPADTQVKLLRTLESNKVTRVGEVQERETDVRILAASNRDPEAAVADGVLREDLYYRLNVFPIHVPPLRVRGEDIVLIANEILGALNHGGDAGKKRLSDEAREKLRGYRWPGNVRELRNVVTRAFILADEEIRPEHLTGLRESSGTIRRSKDRLEVPVGVTIAEAEKELILATLESVGGAKKEAAKVLGISVKTLYNRLHSYAKGD